MRTRRPRVARTASAVRVRRATLDCKVIGGPHGESQRRLLTTGECRPRAPHELEVIAPVTDWSPIPDHRMARPRVRARLAVCRPSQSTCFEHDVPGSAVAWYVGRTILVSLPRSRTPHTHWGTASDTHTPPGPLARPRTQRCAGPGQGLCAAFSRPRAPPHTAAPARVRVTAGTHDGAGKPGDQQEASGL